MNPEENLKYISGILMQHDVAGLNPGLLHGKMGLVVFFVHYARYTGDPLFENHAMALMDNIQEQILRQNDMTYASGLAGIGTGIEYLVQNNFLEADTNEVLEDFDQYIFEATVFGDHTDVSLFTGLTGLGRYSLFRIAGNDASDNHTGTLGNKIRLTQITDILDRMQSDLREADADDVFRFLYDMNRANIFPVKVKRMLRRFSSGSSLPNHDDRMTSYQKKLKTLYSNKYSEFLSEIRKNPQPDTVPDLYGGLAGIGLYILSKIDKQHETWMKLL